jgi:hypothetical protein
VLKERNGRPFVEPTPALEELAAIGAALEAAMSPSAIAAASAAAQPESGAARRWRGQARVEGLR